MFFSSFCDHTGKSDLKRQGILKHTKNTAFISLNPCAPLNKYSVCSLISFFAVRCLCKLIDHSQIAYW